MHEMNVISMHLSYLVALDIYESLVYLKKLHDGLYGATEFFFTYVPST